MSAAKTSGAQAQLVRPERSEARMIALATGAVLGLFESVYGPPLEFGRTPPAILAFRAALRTMVGAIDLRQFPPKPGVLPAEMGARLAKLRTALQGLFALLVASPCCPGRCREGYQLALAALDQLEGRPCP